jgi:hypothetical protein
VKRELIKIIILSSTEKLSGGKKQYFTRFILAVFRTPTVMASVIYPALFLILIISTMVHLHLSALMLSG